MTTLIKNYDPNMHWHVCTYAVTLMQWDYSKTFEIEVGGNVRGFDLIESAADGICDELDDDGGIAEVLLTNPKGDILLCRDEEEQAEDWVKEMIVSVVLIKQEKEKL